MTVPILSSPAMLPRVPLVTSPTPIEAMPRLRDALGGGPALFVKRDDAIAVGFGGNKVRKLEVEAARAIDAGADTLVTCGGVQSNHCRVTAAIAARLGLGCVLVHNGVPGAPASGNFQLGRMFGADYDLVPSREARAAGVASAVARLTAEGRRPYAIPLGASTPHGAAAYALAVLELVSQGLRPDVIIHASSSGGTQAGILAGCAMAGLPTRVIGVSADDPAAQVAAEVDRLAAEVLRVFGIAADLPPAEVDDGFVGSGYGITSAESREAASLFATREALLLDPTYTAKAGAAMIAGVRAERFPAGASLLFWHTGGLPLLFV